VTPDVLSTCSPLAAVVADGAGTLDQGVASLLFIAALLLGWIAVARIRGKGFARLPRAFGWIAAGAAVACVVLALVLPPIIRPVRATRPSSPATIRILSPRAGDVFHGDPASVPVEVRVAGARIVSFTTTKLTPTTGHVHVLIDGAIVAMTTSTSTVVTVSPGSHVLVAEFVAADHLPFSPRVLSSVTFQVEP
jgi:hypothetical protein